MQTVLRSQWWEGWNMWLHNVTWSSLSRAASFEEDPRRRWKPMEQGKRVYTICTRSQTGPRNKWLESYFQLPDRPDNTHGEWVFASSSLHTFNKTAFRTHTHTHTQKHIIRFQKADLLTRVVVAGSLVSWWFLSKSPRHVGTNRQNCLEIERQTLMMY